MSHHRVVYAFEPHTRFSIPTPIHAHRPPALPQRLGANRIQRQTSSTVALSALRAEVSAPGEKPSSLSRSEWTVATLSVHHANFTPEDN